MPNVNPTQIYNEGWMTRLLFSQSIKEKIKFGGLDFSNISKWTSEALISSPFINAEENPEGYTHADIAFGDFMVEYKVSGRLKVNNDAKIFGIIEAKIGSNFSKGTAHAKDYNQASRILACIGNEVYDKDCEIYFITVVPKSRLGKIEEQVKPPKLIEGIEKRYKAYKADSKTLHNKHMLLEKVAGCKILTWSYEDWIEAIRDPGEKEILKDFYNKTITWNRL